MERKLSLTNRNQRFFKVISPHYQDLIKKRDSLPWMRTIVEPRMGEKVLDVGNGGVREFFSNRTSLYVGVDFSLEMLKKGRDGGIQKICGEATTLSFKKEVFDTIFHRSLLHHLAEKSVGRTMERVKTVLRHESTCLKREGNVMMIEPCLPVFLEWIERIFFFILRAVFFLTKQSEIFLFSAESLTRMLEESGYKEIKIWRGGKGERSPWEWVTPFIGLPFLKIPRWSNPVRKTILEGIKRD
jgi:ubiquinone/menaquinone biosynthesis C-methylase UbiE